MPARRPAARPVASAVAPLYRGDGSTCIQQHVECVQHFLMVGGESFQRTERDSGRCTDQLRFHVEALEAQPDAFEVPLDPVQPHFREVDHGALENTGHVRVGFDFLHRAHALDRDRHRVHAGFELPQSAVQAPQIVVEFPIEIRCHPPPVGSGRIHAPLELASGVFPVESVEQFIREVTGQGRQLLRKKLPCTLALDAVDLHEAQEWHGIQAAPGHLQCTGQHARGDIAGHRRVGPEFLILLEIRHDLVDHAARCLIAHGWRRGTNPRGQRSPSAAGPAPGFPATASRPACGGR